jgi:DNA invertase Pin-like site-specific DNA recombinase
VVITETTATTTGRLFAYARVSSQQQDEQLQLDEFKKLGIRKGDTYIDHGVSGSKTSRPQLDQMLADIENGEIEAGDVLVIYKLDRLGRNAGHVITLLDTLTKKGIFVRSIGDDLDTSTPTGEAMMGILAIFAKMELGFIQQRTRAGLATAKAAGRVGGRPRAMSTKQSEIAQQEYNNGTKVAEIAKLLKVSEPTVYRYLAR